MRTASLELSNRLREDSIFRWRSGFSAQIRAAAIAVEVTAALVALALFTSIAAWAAEPQVIQLWPNGAPGSEGKTAPETVRISPEGDHVVSSVHHPSLTVYLPPKEKATGAGVVIIPGGGHRELWMDGRALPSAEQLRALEIPSSGL